MDIANAFTEAVTWIGQGGGMWPLVKIFGAAALVVGTIATPLILIAGSNARKLEERIRKIDSSASVVFNSVADGVSKGYSRADVEASLASARKLGAIFGPSPGYQSGDECMSEHGSCERISTVTMIPAGNNIMVPITRHTYVPEIAGWQAPADDLRSSVLLYTSAKPGHVARFDGSAFTHLPV